MIAYDSCFLLAQGLFELAEAFVDVGVSLLDVLVVWFAFLAVVHFGVLADAAGAQFSQAVVLFISGVPCQQKLVMHSSGWILHFIWSFANMEELRVAMFDNKILKYLTLKINSL